MMKSYQFKLFYNKSRSQRLENELRIFCHIYNHSLRLIRTHYKIFGKNPSENNLKKHLTKLGKTDFPQWAALGYSQGIQEVVERIYKSYDEFFKWTKTRKGPKKSPPKFRPFRKYKSFTLKQVGWKLDEGKGRIKIGPYWYRYNQSRKIQGRPKTINIKRDNVGDWFITICCDVGKEFIPKKVAPMTGKRAGFDFGIKTFLTTSEGEQLQSREFLKQSLKNLARDNRSLSKKKKGSKNRKRSRIQLARTHRKVQRKRTDAHFKMAFSLVQKYDYLFFEDLNLSGMKKLWGRKVSDLGFSNFMKILEFKAVEHGKTVHKIDRFFPSSKLCSNQKCRMFKTSDELQLSDRIYKCEYCDLEIDRDLNAAINIKNEGASSLGLGGVNPDLGLVPAA